MNKIYLILILFCITFTLFCDPPEWEQISGTQFSMLLRTQVTHQGNLFEGINENNILAAFGPGGESDCRAIGFWIDANPPLYENGFWDLGIVSNQFQGEIISFKLYEAESDSVFNCNQLIEFTDGITIGSSIAPYMLSTSIGTIQGSIELDGEGDIESVVVRAGLETAQPFWNPEGHWEYELSVAPGSYDVHASLFGYQESIVEDVEVFADETTENIDFSLEQVDYNMLYLPEELYGVQGGEILIPLFINIPVGITIEGINASVIYDSEILNATGATLSGSILEDQNYTFGVNANNPGEIILGFSANAQLYSGSGIVAFISFEVNSGAIVGSMTELSFSESEINEFYVPSGISYLTVMDQLFTIEGNLTYFKNEVEISNVELELTGDHYFSAVTDQQGNYSIQNIVEGNYTLSAWKLDDLGGLSGTDASRVFRHSIGLYDFDCEEMIAADVTMDASISTTDASRIARYAAGLINDLNSGTDWVFIPETIENCDDWPPIVYESERSYMPLNENLPDQDFLGIRLGDVTGNWSADSRKIIERDDPEAILPELTAGSETSVQVPITVNNLTDMEALDIRIEFDDSILNTTAVTLEGSVLEEYNYSFEFNNNEPDEITLIIFATSTLYTGSGVAAFIEFQVNGEIGESSELTFSQFDVNETDYLANTTNGSITIVMVNSEDTDIPGNLKLAQNYPNPFFMNSESRNSSTTISFEIPENSLITLDVFDLRGRLIDNLINEFYKPGKHSISWDGRDKTNRKVASGIYYYKLKTVNGTIIKKMLVIN